MDFICKSPWKHRVDLVDGRKNLAILHAYILTFQVMRNIILLIVLFRAYIRIIV